LLREVNLFQNAYIIMDKSGWVCNITFV
jgi:hypothetical protein